MDVLLTGTDEIEFVCEHDCYFIEATHPAPNVVIDDFVTNLPLYAKCPLCSGYVNIEQFVVGLTRKTDAVQRIYG